MRGPAALSKALFASDKLKTDQVKDLLGKAMTSGSALLKHLGDKEEHEARYL
jgi:hypothetical protein